MKHGPVFANLSIKAATLVKHADDICSSGRPRSHELTTLSRQTHGLAEAPCNWNRTSSSSKSRVRVVLAAGWLSSTSTTSSRSNDTYGHLLRPDPPDGARSCRSRYAAGDAIYRFGATSSSASFPNSRSTRGAGEQVVECMRAKLRISASRISPTRSASSPSRPPLIRPHRVGPGSGASRECHARVVLCQAARSQFVFEQVVAVVREPANAPVVREPAPRNPPSHRRPPRSCLAMSRKMTRLAGDSGGCSSCARGPTVPLLLHHVELDRVHSVSCALR